MVFIAQKPLHLATTTLFRFVSQRAKSATPKVALLGASGGIGQPLGLLLKQNPSISKLALYDIKGTVGVGADLSHIDTRAEVESYTGPDELAGALQNADIVVIPAGLPRKPGMTRDDLFTTNATIVQDLCDAAAKICPNAFLAVITNPINSTVPIACEVFTKNGISDHSRIFGVTSLDIIRSQTFVAALKSLDVSKVRVPVIGGHSGTTIIPLLSQVQPHCTFTAEEAKSLTLRIQDAGTEVVKAKAGAGSATLSMAFAGARFIAVMLDGLQGKTAMQCAYVKSDVQEGLEYFASPIEIGPKGVKKIHGVGKLSAYEKDLLDAAVPELKQNIDKGIKFIRG